MKETEVKKTKTQKQVQTESTNLKEFATLKNEVMRNTMPDRKKVALISKLVSLYANNIIDEDETALMKDLFIRERALGHLSTANMDILCALEVKDCELECYVKTDDTPPVHGLVKDTTCKYTFDPMIGKNKTGEIEGRYVVFIPKTIPGDAQLDMNNAIKRDQGKDYFKPADRVIWKRIPCNKKEFETWFGYDDEAILGNKTPEEITYRF